MSDLVEYEEIGEVYRMSQVEPESPRAPRYEATEQTSRRLEANKTLPSRRSNPSTLNRKNKPLSERLTDLREAKEVELKHRRKWSCCQRVVHHVTSSVTSSFNSCLESLSWNFRGACKCTCACTIWGNPISQIEGYLGSHVSTYFKAMVWLLKINLACMVLGLGLIVLPAAYIKSTTQNETLYNRDSTCYNSDIISGESREASNFNSVLQFFTG